MVSFDFGLAMTSLRDIKSYIFPWKQFTKDFLLTLAWQIQIFCLSSRRLWCLKSHTSLGKYLCTITCSPSFGQAGSSKFYLCLASRRLWDFKPLLALKYFHKLLYAPNCLIEQVLANLTFISPWGGFETLSICLP